LVEKTVKFCAQCTGMVVYKLVTLSRTLRGITIEPGK